MESIANGLIQERISLYDEICAFFTERQIIAINGTEPDRRLLTLSRPWTEGRCIIFNQSFRESQSGTIQWLRANISFPVLIDETAELITSLIGQQSIRRLSCFDALERYTGIDPFTDQDCSEAAAHLGLELHPDCEKWDRNTWLRFLFTHAVQSHLGQGEISIVLDFPSSLFPENHFFKKEEDSVAEHFEIYFQGLEIAAGQRKSRPPIDESFLASLKIPAPDLLSVSLNYSALSLFKN